MIQIKNIFNASNLKAYLILVPNGPPTKFQISRVDATNITASWLPPDPALRNGRIINYKLCIKIGSTSQGPCLLQVTTGNITVYTFSNLKPYTKYYIRISAATKIGYGPSAVLTTKTVEAGKKRMNPKSLYGWRKLNNIKRLHSCKCIGWSRLSFLQLHFQSSYKFLHSFVMTTLFSFLFLKSLRVHLAT